MALDSCCQLALVELLIMPQNDIPFYNIPQHTQNTTPTKHTHPITQQNTYM